MAEVDRAFAAFKAYRKKVPTQGGDYTVDHSAGVYLYDRDGGFAGTLDMHEDMKVRAAKVIRLIEGSDGGDASLVEDGIVRSAAGAARTTTEAADVDANG